MNVSNNESRTQNPLLTRGKDNHFRYTDLYGQTGIFETNSSFHVKYGTSGKV